MYHPAVSHTKPSGDAMADVMTQSGVIALHNGRLCMVTSRSGRRWVFPKGQIDQGHSPGVTALIEAWEEAGLVGTLDPEPVGSYVYEKVGCTYHVLLFVMRVSEVRDSWPEKGSRERAWVTQHEAMERVEEPSLRDLLKRVFTIDRPNPGNQSNILRMG
jgi:8-oxo-dGTP pyrophosphatase MutT (NUDIX family)